jgi:hypothetical protein
LGKPETPKVSFAEFWLPYGHLRSRATLFASFSGKRRILINQQPLQNLHPVIQPPVLTGLK